MQEQVKCEKLDHQGRGIAKINGKVVFVPNFLVGEEALIKITKDKKKYSEGEIIDFKITSNDRVQPKCPYLNCGCTLKQLDYLKQLEYKENNVKEVLKRFGNLEPLVLPIIPSDNINGYRNKITLKVNEYVGYHKVHTNDFLAIKKCELVSDKVNELIEKLNTLDLSKVTEIIIKEFDNIMIIIKGYMDINPIKNLCGSIYLSNELVYGEEFINTKIKDLTFKIGRKSFFQVNKYMVEKLYDTVLNYLGKDENKKVLDLYCGTGTISLFLAKNFKEVIGIEVNEEAIKCANENKKVNNISNVKFICGDVANNLDKLQADIVVVDPPRSGLNEKTINDILNIEPSKIVYVSCDPITLARDLRVLGNDYNIEEVQPVDMFPNTHHVENVVKLIKKRSVIINGFAGIGKSTLVAEYQNIIDLE